jgi:hypothetical protein
MSSPDSWEVILRGDINGTVLVVDFSAGIHRELDFVELEARIGSRCRYLLAKLPVVGLGKRLSSAACVSTWSEDIRRAGQPVTAVFGSRVGCVYAAAIADRISCWQRRPAVVLLDPQTADIELLNKEFLREIISLNSLFSSDEIERARKIGHETAESTAEGVAGVAAKMFEDYLEVITTPFERVGLGDPRGSRLTEPFESYISLISAADQINQGHFWGQSTFILSSDCPDILDEDFSDDGRRIRFDVRHVDLFRSDLITATISDLLQPR